jgi:hypothetical protein
VIQRSRTPAQGIPRVGKAAGPMLHLCPPPTPPQASCSPPHLVDEAASSLHSQEDACSRWPAASILSASSACVRCQWPAAQPPHGWLSMRPAAHSACTAAETPCHPGWAHTSTTQPPPLHLLPRGGPARTPTCVDGDCSVHGSGEAAEEALVALHSQRLAQAVHGVAVLRVAQGVALRGAVGRRRKGVGAANQWGVSEGQEGFESAGQANERQVRAGAAAVQEDAPTCIFDLMVSRGNMEPQRPKPAMMPAAITSL